MNVKLYPHYGAVDLWISYSEWSGDLQLDSIYLGSDPQRTDLIDFLSDSVLAHADSVMREDWNESYIDRAEYLLEDR